MQSHTIPYYVIRDTWTGKTRSYYTQPKDAVYWRDQLNSSAPENRTRYIVTEGN